MKNFASAKWIISSESRGRVELTNCIGNFYIRRRRGEILEETRKKLKKEISKYFQEHNEYEIKYNKRVMRLTFSAYKVELKNKI